MKKYFIILIILFLCVGCNNDKYFICTIDVNNTQNKYSLNANYKIYYDNVYVTKIEKDESYLSEDSDILQYFDEFKNLEFDDLNKKYGGYKYNITSSDNQVIIKASIDLKNSDISKMIKDQYINKDYTVSNKLTVNGVKHIYEAKGAVCDI